MIRGEKRIAGILSLSGYMITTVILASTLKAAPGFRVCLLSTLLGCILVGVFAFLLLYSVVFEIPLQKKRLGLKGDDVLMQGTYGLCRHPGFLWFLALMLSLFLIHRSTFYLGVTGYLIVLNFILVLAEDRILFPKIFPDYVEYQRTVPFLLPEMKRSRVSPD